MPERVLEFPDPIGGTWRYRLPPAGPRLGFKISRSLIPNTPPWEWWISNIAMSPFPGLVNGFTTTEEAATESVRAALAFWRARGYETVEGP